MMVYSLFCIVPLSIEFDKIKTLEYDICLSSLLEIEEAADVLPAEEKRELFSFSPHPPSR
jgi:hypothetical protein